ncbi:MAG TPA: hypothetical protein VLA16_09825 [Ideonella sp.]|nr:hypothetical protein [Ideonella sp.]
MGRSGQREFYTRMFLWTPETGMLDVNDLVDPADPLKGVARLDDAAAVNASGQIVGQALIRGQLRAVLLTPVR